MATRTPEGRTRPDEPLAVHVSDALQARLDTYREQHADRTTTSVVFEAVEQRRGELPELVRTARARLRSPAAQETVHHLGTGPVLIRVRPSADQAAVLDELSGELGVPVATWLPALLNAHLPGRREPENMPWLVLEEPAGEDG
ncbi:hypothetical protein [Salinifilum ghardaiensis]